MYETICESKGGHLLNPYGICVRCLTRVIETVVPFDNIKPTKVEDLEFYSDDNCICKGQEINPKCGRPHGRW